MPLKRFNILHLSSYGRNGWGGQESLFYLVSNLNREVFRPCVIVPTTIGGLASRLTSHNIEVRIVKLPKVMDFHFLGKIKAFRQIFRLIDELKIDLIHSDGPRNTFYGGLAARLKNIPLVWHVRASNPDRYDRLLYKISSKIIIVANALRSRFAWDGKYNKIITIHNGVDLSEFQPQRPGKSIRKKYGVNDENLLISATARIEQFKGQKYLIEACGHIKDKIRDFRLLLAGESVDPSYVKECQNKAKAVGIEDRVIFTGHVNNVSQILNETDIFVLPSLFEAFPRSVIEAMGTGTPVIVTDVGGCIEAVEDKVSGFVVPAQNAKALADKILLLASNRDLRLNVANEARKRAVRLFGIHENVNQTERLYREILSKR